MIIGNGQSVLCHRWGSLIDTFPTVGRINNYTTSGFEEFVGSQTHIWFNGANQNLKKRTKRPDRIVVIIPAEILKEKGESIHKRIAGRLSVSQPGYELVSLSEIQTWEQESGLTRPTTGTASIFWGLDRFKEVIIHGFDFFIDTKAHYNDRKWIRWLIQSGIIKKAKKHDMTSEKRFIENLLNEGKIKRLSDYA